MIDFAKREKKIRKKERKIIIEESENKMKKKAVNEVN